MKSIRWFPRVSVSVAKSGAVVQPGGVLLAETLTASGLASELEGRLDRFTRPGARHHVGKVIADLAVAIGLGEDDLAGIGLIRDEPRLYGQVASDATVSRRIGDLAADVDAGEAAIWAAHAAARSRVWDLLGDRAPGHRRSMANPLVIDLDATLIGAHSDKEQAAGTWKGTFGFHPLTAFIDHGPGGQGEIAAVLLRKGSAGSNTVDDHVTVTKAALGQIPGFAGRSRADRTILVRTDGGGGTHGFAAWLDEHRFSYSLGVSTNTVEMKEAIEIISERFDPQQGRLGVWSEAVDADGDTRKGAWVAEVTGVLDMSGWPKGARVIVRKERPHPGAQTGLFDVDGYRHVAFLTNTPTGGKRAGGNTQLATLELRHRRRARCEDRIRCAKQTGLGALPLHGFAQNRVWAAIAALAIDLLAWMQLLALYEQPARVWEPGRLRLRLFAIPATIASGGRRLHLKLATHSRWSNLVLTAIESLRAAPAPT